MRYRRIGPVLCLDQHRGLAAGNRVQPRCQWIAGVTECWRVFWRNAIVGDVLFSGVLFTAWAVAGHTTSSLRPLTHSKRILPDGLPA